MLVTVFMGCKKQYNPAVINNITNYLVVEGNVNTGGDSTIFFLSRTVKVAAKTAFKPELNAQLYIEDNKNNQYQLSQMGNGKYASPALTLNNTFQYRLRITTADGKTYLSDFVDATVSPAIDSVGYMIKNTGLNIYLNTHDASGTTKYYRWDYTETWKFNSYFPSFYKVVNLTPVPRNLTTDQVNECWGNDTSSSILLASTAGLSQPVIYQAPIVSLPSSAEKLEDRYSINIKQYALTSTAYQFFENLKKNTENLGTIFDALPSEVGGNIHNINNPADPVVGYITAGSVTQKRIYVNNQDLPAWLAITFYKTYGCAADTITLKTTDDYPFYYFDGGFLPTTSPFLAAPAICVDCTLRGTNRQPSFWKN